MSKTTILWEPNTVGIVRDFSIPTFVSKFNIFAQKCQMVTCTIIGTCDHQTLYTELSSPLVTYLITILFTMCTSSHFKPILKAAHDFLKLTSGMIYSRFHGAPFFGRGPNQSWNTRKSMFYEILNMHAPICQKRVKSFPIPWITFCYTIKQPIRARDSHMHKRKP